MPDVTDLLQKNAVVIAGLVLVVIFSVWFVSSFGVPFLGGSPDTFNPESVTTVNETADTVSVRLSDPTKSDRTSVVAGEQEYEWDENNTVRIDKDNLDGFVTVESYTGGNLYESHDYDVGEIQLRIVSDTDSFLLGQTYSFQLVSPSSVELSNVQWTVDEEEKNANSTEIVEAFDEEGIHTLSASANASGRKLSVSRDINVTEPSDVDFEIIVNNSTNVTEFDEIRAKANLSSNQTVEEVTWDWGQNTQNESLPINETSLNWYTESGTYTVKATAITKELGRQVSATKTISVEERPVEQVSYEIAVQVFSGSSGKALSEVNVSLGELVSKETAQDGSVKFDVIPSQYNITAERRGFEKEELSVNVDDNVLLEVVMTDIPQGDEENSSNNSTEAVEEGVDAFDVNRNITLSNNLTEEQIESTAPSGLERLLNNTPGNGTVDDPHLIRNVEELQAISYAPSQSFQLANDIDATNTRGWNPVGSVSGERVGDASQEEYKVEYDSIIPSSLNLTVNGESVPKSEYQTLQNGRITMNQPVSELVENASADSSVTVSYTPDNVYRGFNPISSEGQTSLQLDGRGNTITGLYINRDEDDVGMVSELDSGIIENINLEGVEVKGQDKTGILASSAKNSRIENTVVAGTSTGGNEVGILLGRSQGSNIEGVNLLGSVNGNNNIGMVAGSAGSSGGDNTIIEKASVQTPDNRAVVGNESVGGIVGQALRVDINDSLSISNVVGEQSVGGVAGSSRTGTSIEEGYSASLIESDADNAGAIVGDADSSSITKFYWDTDVAGVDDAVGEGTSSASVEGLPTTDMQGQSPTSTMSELDFGEIWQTTDNYPVVSTKGGLFSVEVSVTDSSTDEEINENVEVTLGGDTLQAPDTTFEDVARGEYTISVNADGYIPSEETLFISESTSVNIALEPAKQYDVSLSAVNVEDNIIPNSVIVLDGQQKTQQGAPVEYNGIDEGQYEPEFEKPTHVNREVDLELSGNSDETISKSIVLRETRNITLTINDNQTGDKLDTKTNISISGGTIIKSLINRKDNPYDLSNIPEIVNDEVYTIVVNSEGYNATIFELEPSEVTNSTTKTVELNRSNDKNVLLLNPEDASSGDLATPVEVEATQLGTGEVITKSTEVGDTDPLSFVFRNSSKSGVGDISVEINSPRYETKRVNGISLEDNKERTITVRNKEDRDITIEATSDGSRIDNAKVTLKSDQNDISYDNSTFTGSEGFVRFSDVINGDYDVEINAKGFDKKSKSVTLGTGDNPTLTLDEQPVAVIELSTDTNDEGLEQFELVGVNTNNVPIEDSDIIGSKTNAGDNNPEINFTEGVRFRFEGSAIDTYDINIVNSNDNPILSQASPSNSKVEQGDADNGGNLDVGYINNGGSFEFTAETELSDADDYRYSSFSDPDGLNASIGPYNPLVP